MRIFLTGATGFIGSAIVPELLQAGHQVLGLTRSESGADALRAAGAEPHFGNIEDLDSLRSGAEKSDGVIHCAFDHDFSNFVANCEKDHRVITTLGETLHGSDRPLVITSGVGLGIAGPGQSAKEDVCNLEHPNPRKLSEIAGNQQLDRGVNVSVVRLPQVHDTRKQGLITPLIQIYRQKGVVAYVGEGNNRWPAAAVHDVGRLYHLALEKKEAGKRYHAVAEEGIPAREIAEVLAEGLKLPLLSVTPEQMPQYFDWMSMFANLDMVSSSTWTRQYLNWTPTGPSMIEDLQAMQY
ncbi:MAG: SDR family oxidoreductase [Acidobacteriaceae bacterium]|nr:SDR family oxidoreductase [Acidobacteriaceae bacterium]